MKIAIRLLKIVGIVVGLLLLAVLVFVATFDANNYKPQLIEQVESATGRQFSIDGEIGLSVFPWIGLKVEKVALGNAQGFSERPFAAIEQLDIKVNLLPLLKKEVKVNTIRLHGLQASLEVADDKTSNWSDIGRGEAVDGEQSQVEDEAIDKPTASGDALPLQSLLVEGIELIDAQIQYDDRSNGTKATVSELNRTSRAIEFDRPVQLEFGARVQNNQPPVDTRLELTTQLTLNKDLSHFNLQDFVFTVIANAEGNEGLGIQQDEEVEIRSAINVLMDDQRITMQPLQITALGVNIQGGFTIAQFQQQPVIQGNLEVLPFDARQAAARVGVALPPMAKAEALRQVSLATKINLQGETLQADDFSIKLDDSSLSGWLHIINLTKQQLRYELTLDRINLNDYLPPESNETAANDAEVATDSTETANAGTGDEKIELPVELMRQLDVQGDFRINSLAVKDYEISQFLMKLTARQGDITVKPLSMQLLDGEVDSSVNMNVQNLIPTYKLDTAVKQVEVGPVVNPFLDGIMGEKPLTMNGAVNLTMAIKTVGESVNQLKKAAKGRIELNMDTTEVNGFDPEYYMRSSVANYVNSKGFGKSETIMGSYKPREVTVFDLIYSTVELTDGKASTRDFLMDSKRVQVRAEGYADIVNNTLDVTSSVKLPRGKTTVEKILDSPVYVRVHGPFDALQYDLDERRLKASTTDQLEKEAKRKLDEEKQRLEEEAKEKARKELERTEDKLKNKLQDKLKGLF